LRRLLLINFRTSAANYSREVARHCHTILQSEAALRASPKGARAISYEDLPKVLPAIELHHGEAIWVLSRLGYQGAATKSTFYEYIKSLRKLGSPFAGGKIGRPGGLANYSYCHMMELALVLTLRVYYFVPDSVLSGIVRHRTCLYHHYRRAYAERYSGIGAPVIVKASGHPPIHGRGMFLDLQINFSGGKLVKFGPPKLLSTFEALTIFAKRDVAARALLPINLSLLSERLVATALRAPPIRRGTRAAKKTIAAEFNGGRSSAKASPIAATVRPFVDEGLWNDFWADVMHILKVARPASSPDTDRSTPGLRGREPLTRSGLNRKQQTTKACQPDGSHLVEPPLRLLRYQSTPGQEL
jgi:hypothetical protein